MTRTFISSHSFLHSLREVRVMLARSACVCFPTFRFGKRQVWQQDGYIWGAHQSWAQHVALLVLHRPGEGQGLHRVHRSRELRGRNDPGEDVQMHFRTHTGHPIEVLAIIFKSPSTSRKERKETQFKSGKLID